MFDIAPTELLLVGIVALLVIGPKDLPKAMRLVGYWVGKARGVARQFRSGFDSMVREAELAELEKQWAAENARIMREHPSAPAPDGETPAAADTTGQGDSESSGVPELGSHGPESAVARREPTGESDESAPVMVERPVVEPAPASDSSTTAPDKAAS